MQDRRLVLIIQGDEATTNFHFWLETPCDEHGPHVVTNQVVDVESSHIASPHAWMMSVLQKAAEDLCLCGAQGASPSVMTTMLEATRG